MIGSLGDELKACIQRRGRFAGVKIKEALYVIGWGASRDEETCFSLEDHR